MISASQCMLLHWGKVWKAHLADCLWGHLLFFIQDDKGIISVESNAGKATQVHQGADQSAETLIGARHVMVLFWWEEFLPRLENQLPEQQVTHSLTQGCSQNHADKIYSDNDGLWYCQQRRQHHVILLLLWEPIWILTDLCVLRQSWFGSCRKAKYVEARICAWLLERISLIINHLTFGLPPHLNATPTSFFVWYVWNGRPINPIAAWRTSWDPD